MYTFKSVAALCGLLEQAYHAGPGETGRAKFVDVLKTTFEFGDRAADLYAGTASRKFARVHCSQVTGSEPIKINQEAAQSKRSR